MKANVKQTHIFLIVLALALLGCSCSTPVVSRDEAQEQIVQSTSSFEYEELEEHQEAEKEEIIKTDYEELYAEVLEKYYVALSEQWDGQALAEASLNILCAYTFEDTPLSSIGYLIVDVDNNGIPELLIGSLAEDGFIDKMVFDMYTMSKDQPELVLQGWERNRYYLCLDNSIANERSGGAGLSVHYIYDLESGKELAVREGIIYENDYDVVNPWYFTSDNDMNTSNDVLISEEDAWEKLKMYKEMHIQLELKPFSKYNINS
ncbi:MAG: hypothetical protein ACOYJD_06140 [Christensenellales bacterium]